MTVVKGNNKSLGYKRISDDYEYTNHELYAQESDLLYISTDGYMDQNGGERNNSFGRRRFEELINENYKKNIHEQRALFDEKIAEYMGSEPQRDDITILCGRL